MTDEQALRAVRALVDREGCGLGLDNSKTVAAVILAVAERNDFRDRNHIAQQDLHDMGLFQCQKCSHVLPASSGGFWADSSPPRVCCKACWEPKP